MYTDTGFLYPYFQNFSQEIQQLDLEELYHLQKPQSSSMNHIFTNPSISDYDLGDGDLFNAPPKSMIEEQPPIMGFDPILEPMSAAMSMISCGGDDVMLASIEETEQEDLLSEVLSECAKDVIIGNNIPALETQTPAEILDIDAPPVVTGTNLMHLVQTEEEQMISDSQFQKSVSLESLRSLENANNGRLNFLDFPELDFGAAAAAYGMRRAFSEGDIQKLGCGSNNIVGLLNPSPLQRPLVTGSCSFEDRQEKLYRYRNKKSRRNFGRKIKYACRKALADSQPRIRGRFAKTEDSSDICKREE